MSEAAHPQRQAQERQTRLPDFKRRTLHEPGLFNPPTVEDDDWWPGKAGDDA